MSKEIEVNKNDLKMFAYNQQSNLTHKIEMKMVSINNNLLLNYYEGDS